MTDINNVKCVFFALEQVDCNSSLTNMLHRYCTAPYLGSDFTSLTLKLSVKSYLSITLAKNINKCEVCCIANRTCYFGVIEASLRSVTRWQHSPVWQQKSELRQLLAERAVNYHIF